jgi:predicted CXXCH cytochrome family protein
VPAWDQNTSIKTFLPLPVTEAVRSNRGLDPLKPHGPSFDCLGCHDGVLGADVHQLGQVSGRTEARVLEMQSVLNAPRPTDHPDSILYPRRPDGEMSSDRPDPSLQRYWAIPDRDENGTTLPTGPTAAALNLQNIDTSDPAQTSNLIRTFLGVIHCDTCHNPHVNANRPFLRLPAKDICLACHQR